MASVMKKENASVMKKGCHENKLDPGRDSRAMKTEKTRQRKCVSAAEAVRLNPYIRGSASVSLL